MASTGKSLVNLPASILRSRKSLLDVRPGLSSFDANKFISHKLKSSQPFMAGRMGSVELNAVKFYKLLSESGLNHGWFKRFFDQKRKNSVWPNSVLKALENNAGFYPATPKNVERFCNLIIELMPNVDLLGSWIKGESVFAENLSSAKICKLNDLEPYYHQEPWSYSLKDKKVLVIHPFSDSIQRQFKDNRKNLFSNPKVLPEFQLKTLTAVQSIAGNRPIEYADWFSALDSMYQRAADSRSEVVIIGCGAYGFPLAAMLKRSGKQVIHLGGATQILFGIKGKRWSSHVLIKNLFNEYWINPSVDETPVGSNLVEGSCYW